MTNSRIYHRIFAYILILALALPSIAQDGDDQASDTKEGYPDKTPEQIVEMQNIIRARLLVQAEDLVKEGKELFFKKKYPELIQKFVLSEKQLRAIGTNVVATKNLVDVREYLKQAYMAYANRLLKDAKELLDEGKGEIEKYDQAKVMLLRALEYDPKLSPIINQWIKRIEAEKIRADFQNQTHAPNVDPEFNTRKRKVHILLERGKVFFRNEQYMRARDEFEKVLMIEPGNEASIGNLKFVYIELRRIARDRRKQMISKYMAEVEWKWAEPLPVQDRGPEGGPKGAKLDSSPIHRKLKEIIIPKISFEDASIETVIKFLKERSRTRDMVDGTGVNIILYRKPKISARASRTIEEDGGDEEFEDFDEDVEDDKIDISKNTHIKNGHPCHPNIPLFNFYLGSISLEEFKLR